MKRALATLMLVLLAASTQARRKIFISVDMEGITGVVQPAQLGPDGFDISGRGSG